MICRTVRFWYIQHMWHVPLENLSQSYWSLIAGLSCYVCVHFFTIYTKCIQNTIFIPLCCEINSDIDLTLTRLFWPESKIFLFSHVLGAVPELWHCYQVSSIILRILMKHRAAEVVTNSQTWWIKVKPTR